MKKQPIILLTGASRGIGYATAKALTHKGAHVIALARTQGALEELDNEVTKEAKGSLSLVPVDLKDFDALKRLADIVEKRWGYLDGLIANGAMLGPVTPLEQITSREMAEVLTINTLANHALIKAFDPLLRSARRANLMFVTSGATRSLRPFLSAYSASKAALEALIISYAKEVAHTNMKVNLFDPGIVATHMRRQLVPGETPSNLTQPEEIGTYIQSIFFNPDFKKHGEILKFSSKS